MDEGRFQWGIQQNIKVKSLPYLIQQLYYTDGSPDLDELEYSFLRHFKSTYVETTSKNQRPFMRTMNFLKNDLQVLNEDYSLKDGIISEPLDDIIRYVIYEVAKQHLIPFRLFYNLYTELNYQTRSWDDLRRDLSQTMIIEARDHYPVAFNKKDKRIKHGIYFWEINDKSLNRLLEIARYFNLCTFIINVSIVFVSEFKYESPIKTIDFEELILLLSSNIENFNTDSLITYDEILEITERNQIPNIVVEYALLSNVKCVNFFSGRTQEEHFITYQGEDYYKLHFNEKVFTEAK